MLKGLRVAVAVPVVVGRVGGLFRVLLEAVPRVVEVVGLDVVEDEVGRLAVVELDTGRFDVAPGLVLLLAGEAGTFSLDASGLDLTSSAPDRTVESTGVAGGAFSVSTSTSEGVGIGSSVEAILFS